MQQYFYHDFSALEMLKETKPLLVCDNAFDFLNIHIPSEYVRFSGFTPNPRFEDVLKGAEIFSESCCDFIVAIGGGSSIDTAKCIKHLCKTDVPLLAVPTTAGTGSESTHFAAIYKEGRKISIADKKLLPNYVVLVSSVLKTLPLYQKKCTMLDALCQAIESWWSRMVDEESITYSKQAIKLILQNMDSYLKNDDAANENMLMASNLAGRAINITTTTAPHAMSYMLSILYNIPHGHAVALCLPKVWRHMKNYDAIADALGKKSSEEAIIFFEELLCELEIFPPKDASLAHLDILADSVNTQRLENNPVVLDTQVIRNLYKEILQM